MKKGLKSYSSESHCRTRNTAKQTEVREANIVVEISEATLKTIIIAFWNEKKKSEFKMRNGEK